MADPRHVRPHELEILVARELRKGGLELSPPKAVRRRALSREAEGEYAVELATAITHGGTSRDSLIECRNERRPVGVDSVRALAARLEPAAAAFGSPDSPAAPAPDEATPRRRLGLMFSTSGYDLDAVREASASGITLFAIADGPAAFRRSQWSMGAQTPAWVPEYMAELVDIDAAGSVRHRLLTAGGARLPLDR